MAKSRQKLILLSITALLSAGLIALGALAGAWIKERSFQRHFREVWKAETLGRILKEEEKEQLAQAYADPAEALRGLDGYAWSIANVPTPFVGAGPRPGLNHNAVINSRQFRAADEVELPKPVGEWRIFLTGGSTAFGVGAPDQRRTIGGYLQQLLNEGSGGGRRYRVFTLANASWASTHERIAIENLLSELQPDLVISLSGVNDVHWAQLGRNIFWFRTYQEELFWRLTDTVYRAFDQEGLVDVEERQPQPVDVQVVARRLEKNVRLASEAISMSGAEYLYALQPALYLTGKPLSPRESQRLQKEKLTYFRECYGEIRSRLAALQHAGTIFLDLTEVFDGLDASQEIFLDSYHFGDRGNRIVAQRLAEWVRRGETAESAAKQGRQE